MRKVYAVLAPLGLGSVALGATSRAFTGVRDGSFAFGDIKQNLKLLADENDYLKSVSDTVVLPRKGEQPKSINMDKKLRKELEKEEESTTKQAYIDVENVKHPFTTFFRGSANPTGKENAADIPALAPLALLTFGTSFPVGNKLMSMKLKRVADNKVKKQKEQAKREFDAALIYEQEASLKRNKKASEECELVQAVDAFYEAANRYETLTKTAGWETSALTLAGFLTLLGGGFGLNSGYKSRRNEVEKKEKEKMLGLNADYEEILRNLEAKNLQQTPLNVGKFKTHGIHTSLVKESALKKSLGAH